MKPPFEIIKQGEAKLDWGLKPDGRFWLRATCKWCGALGSMAVGGKASGSKVYNKALSEAAGYSLVKYRKQVTVNGSARGWNYGSVLVTYVSDLCTACRDRYCNSSGYMERSAGRAYRSTKDLPTAIDHFYRWMNNENKTMIRKALKAQGEGL